MKRKNSANTPTSQPKGPQAPVFKTDRKAAKTAAPPAAPPTLKAAPAKAPDAPKPATPAASPAKAKKAAPAKPEPVKPKAAAVSPAAAAKPAASKPAAKRSVGSVGSVPSPKPAAKPAAKAKTAAPATLEPVKPKAAAPSPATAPAPAKAGKPAPKKVEPAKPAPAPAAVPASKQTAKPVAPPAKAIKAAIAKPAAVKPKASPALPAAPAKPSAPVAGTAKPAPAKAKKPAPAKPKAAAKPAARSAKTIASAPAAPSLPSPKPPANSPQSLPAPKPAAALAAPSTPAARQIPPAKAAAALLPTPRPPAIVVVPEPAAQDRPSRLAPPPTPVSFPAILLEPEDPTPVADPLPSDYGFSRVHLAAREPHVLSVIWELAGEPRASLAPGSKLSLLIHSSHPLPGLPFMLDLPAGESFLFVTVPHADTGYQVELGHLDATGVWKSVAVSGWVHTPPEAVAPLQSPVFVTLPTTPQEQPAPATMAAPAPQPVIASNPALLPEPHPAPAPEPAAFAPEAPAPAPHWPAPSTPPPSFARESTPTGWSNPFPSTPPPPAFAEEAWAAPTAPPPPARSGPAAPPPPAWPGPAAPSARSWTRAHTEVLTHLAGIRPPQLRSAPNSGTLADLGEILTQTLAVTHESRGADQGPLAAPTSPVPSQPARPAPRGFWLNINAEVIVYGATDPAARVFAGGRPVRLREDGTFSFRFSLPDGRHPLPFQAISPDGFETRSAALTFSRASVYSGAVAAHPQDPALRPPSPDHI